MSHTIQADPDTLNRDYQRALELPSTGCIQAGSRLLGDIARQTGDDVQHSQCLFNLGEILEKLEQTDKAYHTWYALAHKSTAQRNEFDIAARRRVMMMFEKRGLRLCPPDFPPRVQLEITNRCNLRCIMCTRNQMTRELGDMSFDVLKKIADECSTEPGIALCL